MGSQGAQRLGAVCTPKNEPPNLRHGAGGRVQGDNQSVGVVAGQEEWSRHLAAEAEPAPGHGPAGHVCLLLALVFLPVVVVAAAPPGIALGGHVNGQLGRCGLQMGELHRRNHPGSLCLSLAASSRRQGSFRVSGSFRGAPGPQSSSRPTSRAQLARCAYPRTKVTTARRQPRRAAPRGDPRRTAPLGRREPNESTARGKTDDWVGHCPRCIVHELQTGPLP